MDNFKKEIRMVQKSFIDSWPLPCLLRLHRIANPRPKMDFAIFGLCPPTTLIQANSIKMKYLILTDFFTNFAV
jgi:hypothetical protein